VDFYFLISEAMNNGNTEELITGAQEVADSIEDLEAIIAAEDTGAGTKKQDPLNTLYRHHPEAVLDYRESVIQKLPLKSVPPFSEEDIDKNHKSQPFLTQYEKTRILGFRTNQLAQGAKPFVAVPEYMKSTLEIARLELEQRRLPFLVKRPMPDGTFEYWKLSDLLIL
jgi:DNA-directed RNA polymerase subunit K/omega